MEFPTLEIVGILACLVMSGLFSGSETALASLSPYRMEQTIERHAFWGRALSV